MDKYRWLQLLVLAVTLSTANCGKKIKDCTSAEVQASSLAAKKCNPLLATLSTIILNNTGKPYTDVCRVYSEYGLCMSVILDCFSSFLDQFQKNNKTYTSLPYNCTPPPEIVVDYYPLSHKSTASNTNNLTIWHLISTLVLSTQFCWFKYIYSEP